MVPGFVAGHYTLDDCAIDLAALSKRAPERSGEPPPAWWIPSRREVVLADGPRSSTTCSRSTSARARSRGEVKGVERHAVPVRPLEVAAQGWERVRKRRGAVAGSLHHDGGGRRGGRRAGALRCTTG
jgi:selenide,water dikinase